MPVLSNAEGPVLRETEKPPTSAPTDLPQRIFSPIARDYDRPALILSLFQYRRWHQFLLSRVLTSVRPEESKDEPSTPAKAEESKPERAHRPTARVLDMATGTGAIAFEILARTDAQVIGADVTRPMLLTARARAHGRFDGRLNLIECTAEAPPFAAASFDAVTFAYLLRYVADVPGTLHALARLLRPGGTMAALDFAVPPGVWHPLWRFYTAAILPAGGRLFSRDWREVGAFLGPSIRDFDRRWPEERVLNAWREAGFTGVRSQRLSLGGAIVIWGAKGK
jgi:demethylmenaquinone methyltransferase / 2-methoxy-6-polyprenyl-1,4-benzoquinol methylase